MRAAIVNQAGGPEVLTLTDLPKPEMTRPDQLLIRVKAASLNPIDYKVRRALDHFPVQRPLILGHDGAGVVEAVGSHVRRFKAGDEVYFCQPPLNGRQGSHAEFAVVDEVLVAHKPKNLSFAEAAAVPLVLITAWEALYDQVSLPKGAPVLIEAGGGGVGHMAIQLAHLAGCRVATTVSTDEKVALVERAGAEKLIRYREQDAVAEIERWTGGDGVAVAMDNVGGEVFNRCCRATRLYGEVVTILEPPPDMAWWEARLRNLKVAFEMMLMPVWLEKRDLMRRHGEILEKAASLFEEGKLFVHVGATFPLEEIARAHELLETTPPAGKVVVVIES